MFLLRTYSPFTSVLTFLRLPPFHHSIRDCSCRIVLCRAEVSIPTLPCCEPIGQYFLPNCTFYASAKAAKNSTKSALCRSRRPNSSGPSSEQAPLLFYHSGTGLSILSTHTSYRRLHPVPSLHKSRWMSQLLPSHLMRLLFLYWQW